MGKEFLPDDKQYLITLSVPCKQRANEMTDVELTDEGEWRKISMKMKTKKIPRYL